MKDIILVIAVLLALSLTVVVVRFSEKATKASKSLEEERYSRMVAEETLQKNAAKLATLEAQVKAAEGKMLKIQDVLAQEKDVNADLKQQYERLAQTKAELEEKVRSTIEAQEVQAAQVVEDVQVVQEPVAAAQ